MTVQNEIPSNSFQSTGDNEFQLDYYVHEIEELLVTLDGAIVNPNLYTIQFGTLQDYNGAKVIFEVPITGTLVIARNTSLERVSSYSNTMNNINASNLNNDFDRIYRIQQEQKLSTNIVDNRVSNLNQEQELATEAVDARVDLEIQNRYNEDLAIRGYVAGLALGIDPLDLKMPLLTDIDWSVDNKGKFLTEIDSVDSERKFVFMGLNKLDINGLENVDNTSDADKPISTLVQAEIDILTNEDIALNTAINSLANGSTKAYLTFAALDAAKLTLPTNSFSQVTNDSNLVNNGIWQWDGTVLTKSTYDPLAQAKLYTDASSNLILNYIPSKNMYNPANKVDSMYLNNTGELLTLVDWGYSGMIAVTAGQSYTLSHVGARRVGLAFYKTSSSTTAISGSFVASSDNPLTVTAPAGANFVAFNLYSSATPIPSNIQFELGLVKTLYEVYVEPYRVLKNGIGIISSITGLQSTLDTKVNTADVLIASAKPYDIITESKNLFATSNIVNNSYLNSANGGIQPATGWTRSGMIPVTAGQAYTLSGVRGRLGLTFFSDDTPILYNGTATLPLTVTAPAGANFVAFNLESPASPNWSNIQFELGATATSYADYGDVKFRIDGSAINNLPASVDEALGTFTGGASSQTIKGVQGTDTIVHTVVINKAATHDVSRVFNWLSTSLSGLTLHSMGDDAAPYRLNGTTLGANHGYGRTQLTVASHNKTFIDIGSVWVDASSKQWVLIGIDSETTLSFTSRIDNNNIVATTGTLTHESGGTHTGAVEWIGIRQKQWYPMLKNHSISVTIDGKPIDPSNTTPVQFEHLTVAQSYELMTKTAIVEWLIARTKTNVDLTEYSANSNISVSMAYVFDKYGNCTFSTDILALDAVTLNPSSAAVMFQQTTRLVPTIDGNVYYYMPKALPLTHEGTNYDFAAKADVSTFAPTTRLDMTPDRVALGVTLDRVVQLTNNWGYATGFLPILSASPANRPTLASRKSLQLNNNGAKIYFSAIDSSSITSMNTGDYYSAVCYRNYFRRPTERTDSYAVCSRQGDYFFMDWHTATTDRVLLPTELHGRAFTISEKSNSVTIYSQIATSSIICKTTGPGFAVLRFT